MPNNKIEVDLSEYDTEEVLLGSLLIQGCDGREAINKVSQILQPFDFKGYFLKDQPQKWSKNAQIYYAMINSILPTHEINVIQEMIRLDILFDAACAYLKYCIGTVPCSLLYMDYAKAVKENSKRRQIKYYAQSGNLNKLNQITQVGFKGGVDGL